MTNGNHTFDLHEVRRRLDAIEAAGNSDSEKAHALEDDLYKDVLHAIAQGQVFDIRAMAALALCAEKIEFPRWCA